MSLQLPYDSNLETLKSHFPFLILKQQSKKDQKIFDWFLELVEFLNSLIPKMIEIYNTKIETEAGPGAEEKEIDLEQQNKEKQQKQAVFNSLRDMCKTISSNLEWFYGEMYMEGGEAKRKERVGIDLSSKLFKFGSWLKENNPNSTLLKNTFNDMVVEATLPADFYEFDEMTFRLFNMNNAVSRYNRENVDILDQFLSLVKERKKTKNIDKFIKFWLCDGTMTTSFLKDKILSQIKKDTSDFLTKDCVSSFVNVFPLSDDHLFSMFCNLIVPIAVKNKERSNFQNTIVVMNVCMDYLNARYDINKIYCKNECYSSFFYWWNQNKDASENTILDEFVSRVVTFLNTEATFDYETKTFKINEFEINLSENTQYNRFVLGTLSNHFLSRSVQGANSLLKEVRDSGNYIKKVCARILEYKTPQQLKEVDSFLNNWCINGLYSSGDLENMYIEFVKKISLISQVIYSGREVCKKSEPSKQDLHYTTIRKSKVGYCPGI